MSNLEGFAKTVAANCFDMSIESQIQEESLGIDWNNIQDLIDTIGQIVMELMNNCPNKKMLKSSIQRPNWLQRIRFKTLVKNNCDCSNNLKLRQLSGKIAEQCISECAKLSDDELEKIILEVGGPENWLI